MPISPKNFKPNNAKSKFDALPMPKSYPAGLDFESITQQTLKKVLLRSKKPAGKSYSGKKNKRGLAEDSMSSRIYLFIANLGRPVSLGEIRKQFNTTAEATIASRLSFLIRRKDITRPMPSFYEVTNG